jgi:hypothetical protein
MGFTCDSIYMLKNHVGILITIPLQWIDQFGEISTIKILSPYMNMVCLFVYLGFLIVFLIKVLHIFLLALFQYTFFAVTIS